MTSLNKQRILIVDDMPTNIQTLIEVLQDLYILMVANNGHKALEMAASETPPDLILLDVIMPEMDGFDVCKTLKANPDTKNIPIIFITSIDEASGEEIGLKAGAIDYLNKPIVPDLVRARVKNHLELHSYQTNLEKRVQEETEKRLEQEKALIQKSKMAAMGEILEAIAHQWTQPLSALLFLMQIIRDFHQNGRLDDKAINNYLGKAEDNIHFMKDTMMSFGQFFKPNREKHSFSIAKECLQIEGFLSPILDKYKIRCLFDIPDTLHYLGYQNEFKQVILNLMNNSKDAFLSASHHPAPQPEIKIKAWENDTEIHLTLQDNAGGIPTNILDNLFKERTSTKEEQGSGIGLLLCKTIIEEHHGGTIQAENRDQGACFLIMLPKPKTL